MMIRDSLMRVSSVVEFIESLREMSKYSFGDSDVEFFAGIEARFLLSRIVDVGMCCESMKFVVYCNKGVDVYIGDDVEEMSCRFGWEWRELRMN